MKILEHMNGRVVIELADTKYPTRITCSDNENFLGTFKPVMQITKSPVMYLQIAGRALR